MWRVKGITVAAALEQFVKAKVIDRMPDDRALADVFETEFREEPTDVRVVMSLVRSSGRFVEALGEDRDIEPVGRHPFVIERLSAVTGGTLVVEHVSQVSREISEGEHASIVQFVSGHRVYRMETETVGRSFDLRAVRAALNRALSDQGTTARFVPFGRGDAAQYLFGDPRAIATACEHLFIPVGDDHSSYKEFLGRVEAFWREATTSHSRSARA